MKKFFRRTAAFLLVAGLTLTSSAASVFYGSKLRAQTVGVSSEVTITDQTFWSSEYSDLRTEYYAEYVPGTGVFPVVAYGEYVKSRQTMETMASSLEDQGLRVVAGINANFYHTKNGIPLGLVISDGVLRSAIPNYSCLGFKADGTAILGTPNVSITARWTTKEIYTIGQGLVPVEETISFSGFNKVREDGGFYLFSDDFWKNTLNNISGIDVILHPVSGEDTSLAPNDTLVCEVVELRDSKMDNSIPAGCFVISINYNSSEEQLNALSSLSAGMQVTLESSIDPDWTDVVSAVSGLYPLVEEGKILSGLSKSINPYTAVGIKADGSVIFYTVDGRQSGHSIGATYEQVAGRLIELGCVSAFAMDGGGSASFGATYPDYDSFRMINQPSDGSARAVSVCLFLVTEEKPTGKLDHYYLTTPNNMVLAGSSVPLQVIPVDTNYYSIESDINVFWNSTLGTVSTDHNGDYLFTAGNTSGLGHIIAYNSEGSGIMEIAVADELSSITLCHEESGTSLSALALTVDEAADLAVIARSFNMRVACSDSDFTWSVEGPVGTVDENGVFTAAHFNGKGSLTVSWGNTSVSIPVVVTGGTPFVDIKDHWAEEYIVQLYALGITNGFTNADGLTTFLPHQSITRGELFTMVVRMFNADLTAYENEELPFADADTLPEWIIPYIKAAYGMGLLRGDLRDEQLYADIDGQVTRETSMVVLRRTLNRSLPADLSGFEDGDMVSEWAAESLQTLVALGVVSGDDNQMLNPGTSALRAEIAKIIVSMLALPQL